MQESQLWRYHKVTFPVLHVNQVERQPDLALNFKEAWYFTWTKGMTGCLEVVRR